MIWSPSIIFPFSSQIIILSASPSKEIPRSTLCLIEKDLIFFGNVDPPVVTLVELREVQAGGEVKFTHKSMIYTLYGPYIMGE